MLLSEDNDFLFTDFVKINLATELNSVDRRE